MSSGLSDLALRELLPPSIAEDDQILAVADGLDVESQNIITDINRFLPYLPNLDNLVSRILDLLAWQYHIDLWDSDASLSIKRERVRAAVAEHKIHGTRAGAMLALDAVFGEGAYTLVEWWQNDPMQDPYTFRVMINVPFDADDIGNAQALLAVTKSVRSHWLGYITWDELDALVYDWDALDALTLSWDQMDEFYFYVTV